MNDIRELLIKTSTFYTIRLAPLQYELHSDCDTVFQGSTLFDSKYFISFAPITFQVFNSSFSSMSISMIAIAFVTMETTKGDDETATRVLAQQWPEIVYYPLFTKAVHCDQTYVNANKGSGHSVREILEMSSTLKTNAHPISNINILVIDAWEQSIILYCS